MPGVAITVSSGDYGYGVQFPASSPHVTAVGGTSLVRTANSRGWSETVVEWRWQRMQHRLRQAKLAATNPCAGVPNGCRRIGDCRSEHRCCGLWSSDVSPFGLDGVRWNQRCCSPDRRRLRSPPAGPPTWWRSVRQHRRSQRRDVGVATAAAAVPIFAPAERAMTARPGLERRSAPPPSKRCIS